MSAQRNITNRLLALKRCVAFLVLCACVSARAEFVYESTNEFFTAGYFNNDTNLDVLVLTKETGIARVGYQDALGNLAWSAPLPTGVSDVSGIAAGVWLNIGADSLAVTAPTFNRVHLVNLSLTNSVPAPNALSPIGIGPNTLVSTPHAQPPSAGAFPLYIANQFNPAPTSRVDVFSFQPGIITPVAQYTETGVFERGNSFQVNSNGAALVAGIVRGASNDTLHIWQFTNGGSIVATLSNLPAGSDYVFGRFNNEALPRFLFYVPGETTLAIRSLTNSGGVLSFGTPTPVLFAQPILGVAVINEPDGSAMVRFGDGIQGMRLPAGGPQIAAKYQAGSGASFSGIAALNNGRFALLTSSNGEPSSLSARVLTFDGVNYAQVSASTLPSQKSRNTTASVWLFQNDPFTNSGASIIRSFNAPDWSTTISGLPGTVSARVESDGGTSSGLGSPSTNNLGSAPAGTAFGLANQYRDDMSFYSYDTPRPVEPVVVNISPPPGTYGGPISISFQKQNGAHQVFYRVNDTNNYSTYASPFTLTNDATIQFYGVNPSLGTRSRLQFASYVLHSSNAVPPGPVILTNEITVTNPPPGVNTNPVEIASVGTVFYSRRSTEGFGGTFYGARPYLGAADSPFAALGMSYFYLENFEDGIFNTPGATPNSGWVVAGPGSDSVDPGGRSYYSSGQSSLTITFNAAALGGNLPTHAGIVWTDVGSVSSGAFGFGNVTFYARDSLGLLIGVITATNLGDGLVTGQTAEDRFFGVFHPNGISSITISMPTSTDWEIDHVQYGYQPDNGSIWSINLDGSNERQITTGSRPRVSADGRWMSFLRDGNPQNSRGNLWLRNMVTGEETRIYTNTTQIVGSDWRGDELIFDHNCSMLRVSFCDPIRALLFPTHCGDDAPHVNPVDGRIAFHNLNPNGPPGIYITDSNLTSKSLFMFLPSILARWPAWSPSGKKIVFADGPFDYSENTSKNLWIAKADGSDLEQFTGLIDPEDGFPHGAIWAPDGHALVAGGTIFGENGLWILPIGDDCMSCGGDPIRLPTSFGGDIDFAGSVIVPQPGGTLRIRRDANDVVVNWPANDSQLETAASINALTWTAISDSFTTTNEVNELRLSGGASQPAQYFRLRSASPGLPDLIIRKSGADILLMWCLTGYNARLQTSLNLSPPVWVTLPREQTLDGLFYQYRLPPSLQRGEQYFRLVQPQ